MPSSKTTTCTQRVTGRPLADLLKREGELKARAAELDETWLEQQQTFWKNYRSDAGDWMHYVTQLRQSLSILAEAHR